MWKRISSKIIFEHPRLQLVEDTVQLPNKTQVPYLKFAHSHDSVTIVCSNNAGEILLLQEYSYPPNQTLYQFPGGKIESAEDALQAAHRELREESGIACDVMKCIGWYYPNNRRSAEKAFVFHAEHPTATKQFGGDPEEDITSEWISVEELERLISDGQITNASLLAAWTLYLHKQ